MKAPLVSTLGVALCLLLTSCETVSQNPLSSPDTAQADPRLVGTWRMKKSQDTLSFTTTKGAWMHVEIIPSKAGDIPESYDFFPTVIGKNTFVNVVTTGKDPAGNPTKSYYFLRYTLSGDHLQMWMIALDVAAEAVRTGKIKGVNHYNYHNSGSGPDLDVTLQDTSENLAKFIQGTDVNKLFSIKMETLYRVKPAGK